MHVRTINSQIDYARKLGLSDCSRLAGYHINRYIQNRTIRLYTRYSELRVLQQIDIIARIRAVASKAKSSH